MGPLLFLHIVIRYLYKPSTNKMLLALKLVVIDQEAFSYLVLASICPLVVVTR